jgi:hypothetical protein
MDTDRVIGSGASDTLGGDRHRARNDGLPAKAKSEITSRMAELETKLAQNTRLQEKTERELQTIAPETRCVRTG